MRQWTPPDPVIDWKDVMIHVESAALKQGFERYQNWHIALKRRATPATEEAKKEMTHTPPFIFIMRCVW